MPAFRFAFTARDYERTVAFYTETLGLPVVHSWDDHGGGTIVAAADGQIEIFGHDGPGVPERVSGVGIAWEIDDVDAEIDRLREAGVAVVVEPADRPWGHRNASIRAPDGLPITLFTVTGPG